MKKKTRKILILGIILIGITGCRQEENKLGGDTLLTNQKEEVLTITTGNKNCIPVQLTLYEDGTYELFTAYESCRPDQNCNAMLKYTKSIKGTYTYDINKIIENSTPNQTHAMDNLPEYEIYLGNSYVEKGYEYSYSVEKGQNNQYLDEFLKEINVNLNVCAEPTILS